MATKPKDSRPAWGFYYDPMIGKIRPLCGKPKGQVTPPKR